MSHEAAGVFSEGENVEDSGWRVATAGAESAQTIRRHSGSPDAVHTIISMGWRREIEKADLPGARPQLSLSVE